MDQSKNTWKITKEGFKFSATHFLIEYPGDCARLHGHNWLIKVTVQGTLDSMGMVVDFRVLKDVCDPIFNELDHRLLVPTNPQVKISDLAKGAVEIEFKTIRINFPRDWVQVVPIVNMTSELLANYLAKRIFTAFKDREEGTRITMISIDLYETHTSKASASAFDL